MPHHFQIRIPPRIPLTLATITLALGVLLLGIAGLNALDWSTLLTVSQPSPLGSGGVLSLLGAGYLCMLNERHKPAISIAFTLLAVLILGVIDYILGFPIGFLSIFSQPVPHEFAERSSIIHLGCLLIFLLTSLHLLLYSLPFRTTIRTPLLSLLGLIVFAFGCLGFIWYTSGSLIYPQSTSNFQTTINPLSFLAFLVLGPLIIVISYIHFTSQRLSVGELWRAILSYSVFSIVILTIVVAFFITLPTSGRLQREIRDGLLEAASSRAAGLEQFLALVRSNAKLLSVLIEAQLAKFPELDRGLESVRIPNAAVDLPDSIVAYTLLGDDGDRGLTVGTMPEKLPAISHPRQDSSIVIHGPYHIDNAYYLILTAPMASRTTFSGTHVFLVSMRGAERVFRAFEAPDTTKAGYLISDRTGEFTVYRFSSIRSTLYQVDSRLHARLYETLKEMLILRSQSAFVRRKGDVYYSHERVGNSPFSIIISAESTSLYSGYRTLLLQILVGVVSLAVLTALGSFTLMLLIRRRAEALQFKAHEEGIRNEVILKETPTGILLLNEMGKIESANPAACSMLDITEEGLTGRGTDDIFYSKQLEDGDELVQFDILSSIEKNPAFESLELEVQNAAGHTLSCSCSCAPLELQGRLHYLLFLIDLTFQKEQNASIAAALLEKNVLLKEIHHRVKNNLQVISSLLKLQSRQLDEPELVNVFEESQNRVLAISLLHQLLYESSNLADVSFESYLKQLAMRLIQFYGVSKKISLDISASGIQLPLDLAMPCGLLLNEILTNSIKHAFPDKRTGAIEIKVSRQANDTCMLEIADDGVGFENRPASTAGKTLGARLITSLTAQIGGTLERRNERGTRYVITFPVPHVQQTSLEVSH